MSEESDLTFEAGLEELTSNLVVETGRGVVERDGAPPLFDVTVKVRLPGSTFHGAARDVQDAFRSLAGTYSAAVGEVAVVGDER